MKRFFIETTLIEYESPILVIDFVWYAEGLLIRCYSDPGGRFYYWSFGDGHDSFRKNPTHLYASPGVYEVSLTVHDCLTYRTVTKSVEVNYGILDSIGWTDLMGASWDANAAVRW